MARGRLLHLAASDGHQVQIQGSIPHGLAPLVLGMVRRILGQDFRDLTGLFAIDGSVMNPGKASHPIVSKLGKRQTNY